jgi:hypothetical protein
MNTFKTKLLLSALGVALLATPAFAQKLDRQQSQASQVVEQYPNGGPVTGSVSNQFDRSHGEYAIDSRS